MGRALVCRVCIRLPITNLLRPRLRVDGALVCLTAIALCAHNDAAAYLLASAISGSAAD